ncbi:MAG: hypothetical protein ABIZ56_11760 [Chthoniobacteraceae bacterium]
MLRRTPFAAISFLAAFAFLSLLYAEDTATPSLKTAEAEYYKIVTLPIPGGIVLEAGALQWLGNGRLAASSRQGDIYMIDNALDESGAKLKFTRFASGLHEVLGLAERDGWIYCTQRGEETRMKDTNGDGRADVFETVGDPWSITGDYHEYAFGSKFDKTGNLWIVLCLTGSFTSEAPYRGWCVRIAPDGKWLPTCSGIRSPGGIGMNAEGAMFYTDNQGPWNGADGLKELRPGAFMGNPAGNKWFDDPATKAAIAAAGLKKPEEPKSGGRIYDEAKRIPEYMPPAILFPYPEMGQSASGILCDTTGGKFGPFADQLFVSDQAHSTVMRVFLEKVNDRYQGACFPFRQGFDSGNLTMEFADDASMFVYGTDRGWGARGGKPFALQRLVWTGRTPFEIHEMRAKADGFELTFTEAVNPQSAANPASYSIKTYTMIYQSSYGSPKVDETKPTITSAAVSPDGKSARLVIDGIVPGHIHELHLPGVKSANGQPLLHPAAYYTLNNIPTK